jgi:ABC-type transporter Mla subunit MlaD
MNTEAKVGAFVIVSTLVLAVAVYSISHTQNVKGQVGFKTYFRYAGGLAPGASVLFGGIKVGQVDNVESSAEDPTRIEVRFNVKAATPINENSTARAGTVTVMGTPSLLITSGSNDARRLRPGEAVQSQETVGLDEVAKHAAAAADSASALMADLRRDLPRLTGDARTVLANLNEITGAANRKRLEGILADVNTMLNRESPKIARITDNVGDITDQLSTMAKHADSLVVSAQPIPAHIDQAVTRANDLLAEVREPLVKDLADLNTVIQQAHDTLAGVQNVLGENRQDVAETVQNLRTASENVRALTETLKQRPWNLVRTTQAVDRKVPQ